MWCHLVTMPPQAEWGRPCSVWLELAAGGVIDLRAHFGFYHPAVVDALSRCKPHLRVWVDQMTGHGTQHSQVVATLQQH